MQKCGDERSRLSLEPGRTTIFSARRTRYFEVDYLQHMSFSTKACVPLLKNAYTVRRTTPGTGHTAAMDSVGSQVHNLSYRRGVKNTSPVLHRPQKNDISPFFCTNLRVEAALPVYLYDVPSFCHNSSHTSDPRMHHPAMDSLVLALECGKATAVFVPSSGLRHCRSSCKTWLQGGGFDFSRTISK